VCKAQAGIPAVARYVRSAGYKAKTTMDELVAIARDGESAEPADWPEIDTSNRPRTARKKMSGRL